LNKSNTTYISSIVQTLTPRQEEFFIFIRDSLASGEVPSVQEIADHFRLKSTRGVCDHLDVLEKKGWIVRDPKKTRSIRLKSEHAGSSVHMHHIPVLGAVTAGYPVHTDNFEGPKLTLCGQMLGFEPNNHTYALVVTGDSMIGRGVYEGDTAIIDGSAEVRAGDMVAALIDQETTLKTFVRKNGKCYLKPENARYKTLTPISELKIQGVARAILRTIR